MAGEAARIHDELVRVTNSQRQRLRGGVEADRWSGAAERFRLDPHRPLDENLTALAGYIEPNHVLIDVGGGAGRFGLPLALRCRELINVEPSPGMGVQFDAAVKEAGITNARRIESPWVGAPRLEGDVTFVSNVTYFVPDIAAFVEKLIESSRRRVMIVVLSVPSPNLHADLFEVATGEPQALVPSYRELLPVLWEMGLLPEVRVLGRSAPTGGVPASMSRQDAIEAAVHQIEAPDPAAARARIDAHFDELFSAVEGGFQRRLREQRMILITWETA